jgi:hypothetical protein
LAERFRGQHWLFALPAASDNERALAGQLITDTLSCVGKQFSESPRPLGEVKTYSDAVALMLCSYLEKLAIAPRVFPVDGWSAPTQTV